MNSRTITPQGSRTLTVLVTGAAGFIGFHVSHALLARGTQVLGVDNLNDYYDVALKQVRLSKLQEQPGFEFQRVDICDHDAMLAHIAHRDDIEGIVHLAAQVGVRQSLSAPFSYVQNNVMGQVSMLELARRLKNLRHFVYASSSSVYGTNTELPFSTKHAVSQPSSLYAVTKRTDELMGHAYAHLYDLPCTGLRFFTVYGPWGRPDMAAWLFTKAILAGKPIEVFNRGDMMRDFTYIDDIVGGVVRALEHLPTGSPRHALYNLGEHKAEKLLDFIAILEKALGRKALISMEPMQPGDVRASLADIEDSRRDLGFDPVTPIAEGLPKFIEWYKAYHNI